MNQSGNFLEPALQIVHAVQKAHVLAVAAEHIKRQSMRRKLRKPEGTRNHSPQIRLEQIELAESAVDLVSRRVSANHEHEGRVLPATGDGAVETKSLDVDIRGKYREAFLLLWRGAIVVILVQSERPRKI